MTMESIKFYSVSEAYGGFSNFSPHPISLKGVTWPTSEHYFQAQTGSRTGPSGATPRTGMSMHHGRRAIRPRIIEPIGREPPHP
jgi:hypothetical protein